MECETRTHKSNIPWATKTCFALEVLGNSPVSAHRQLMTSRTRWLNFALCIIAVKAGREREEGRQTDKDDEGEGLSNWLGQQSGEPEFNFSTSMGGSTSKWFKTDRHCSTEEDTKQVAFWVSWAVLQLHPTVLHVSKQILASLQADPLLLPAPSM